MDPISLAVGGALVVAGWTGGRTTRRRSQAPATPGVICSCGHGYGSHQDGGKCQAQIKRPHYWYDGGRSGYEWAPCSCLFYDGPEPLPRVWTPEVKP